MPSQDTCGDCAEWEQKAGNTGSMGSCPDKKSINKNALAPKKCFKKKNREIKR